MSQAILGLTAGFILIAILLLLVLFKAALSWPAKLALVIVVSGFYWVQYHSLLQYGGWPSEDRLPDEFVLIASDVREPNAATGDAGVMYWWVRESDDPAQPPRVYRLPYRNQMHQQGDEIVEQQKQGKQYVGRATSSGPGSGGFGVEFERISKSERYQKN